MKDATSALAHDAAEEWKDPEVLTPLITQHPNWSTSFAETVVDKESLRTTYIEPTKSSWYSSLFKLFRRKNGQADIHNRTIHLSPTIQFPLIDPATDRAFVSNSITSTRYNLFDFLPKQLYAQFSKVANLYFLFVAIIQMVPGWSPTGQFTTILPLAIFTSIAMAREGYDDLRRKKADQTENNAKAQVLRVYRSPTSVTAVWQQVTWKDVHVGDFVKIEQNDWIPADCILLYSPNEEACGYVETAALDGETNLKKRHAVVTDNQFDTPESLAQLEAIISTELPNADLNNFNGHMQITTNDTICPLTMENLFLRGTVLRNTSFVHGVVVFTGEESKIRMNLSRNVPTKAPSLQHMVNRVVIVIFAFVIALASTCAALAFHWQAVHQNTAWYLLGHARDQASVVFQFVILFNTMIPISLYVTMEMIKLVQAWLISNDVDMYHEETDTPPTAHTSTINEELGQVNFVFSDKTGTLTENLMLFRKLSCGGWAYLHDVDLIPKQAKEIEAIQSIAQKVHRSATKVSRSSLSHSIRRSWQAAAEDHIETDDLEETMVLTELQSAPRLRVSTEIPKTTDMMESIARNSHGLLQQRLQFFLLAISLCHTVIPQIDHETGQVNYQAASPDEYALVNAAKQMGYVIVERTMRHVTLKSPQSDQPIRFDILNVLEFSSKRKRMSIILRMPDNRIVLFCKGADSIVLERSILPEQQVSPVSPVDSKQSASHLPTFEPASVQHKEYSFYDLPIEEEHWEYARTVHHIQQFATEGLRTLLYAHRFMTQKEYDEWNIEYTKATLAIDGREAKLEEVGEKIEIGLRITGATAIEDKLQEGVADSIDRIRKAGMRMWMLTGDKRETAINIGYSCRLIKNESRLIHLEAGPQLESVIMQALTDIQTGRAPDAVLIIDGIALSTIENNKPVLALFCQLGCLCQSVICCRVSPSQKALVVKATRATAPRAVTLAIGDGANDCAMIQEAHVGIGIAGKEGMQAARASDYSIGQFRFLCKLLLVHGHWSYIRVSKFTLGTFLKCMTFYLTQGIFQLWTGFSGTSLYESWSLSFYNTLFSSLPVMMIGVFEKDLRASTLIANPHLYKMGQRRGAFNFYIFAKWILSAWWYAGCIVLIPLAINGTLFVAGGSGPHNGTPHEATIASVALFDGTYQLYTLGLTLYTITVIIVTLKVAYIECHTQTIVSHLVAWAEIGCFVLYNLIYSYAYPVSKSYEYAVKGEFFRLLKTPLFWLIVVFTVTIAIGPSVVGKALSNWFWPSEEFIYQEYEKDSRLTQLWEAETQRQILGVEKKTIINNNETQPTSTTRSGRWQLLRFSRKY
ncbi:hypothetical protein INT44_005258 [Umbelopsis vinacea]|uniref:Phospholipid-transporting ATPase n=1 Tax=Umbelopsis vinacea TaxID=44442 RepID=A0A8H7UQT9_9FUNG|nr:hypothetical protein INT44_005258 [Umbelopsis vinacea]